MGSFGIFSIVVTFIFVIYYVAMISLDLFGTKGEKKESVEVIHTSTSVNNTESAPAVSVVRVSEDSDGKYQIERRGDEVPETYGGAMAAKTTASNKADGTSASHIDEDKITAKDITDSDTEELARQAQAKVDSINGDLNSVSPDIQGAVYVDEFVEDCQAALLKAKQEDEQAEQFSV